MARLDRRPVSQQEELIRGEELYHETILTKLDGLYTTRQFWNVSRCGKEEIYRTCEGCGEGRTFYYHCNVRWCPLCAGRLAAERQRTIKAWLETINQPKHIVTTQRNSETFTGRKIREHQRNLSRLRRTEVFSKVKGGCVSVEVTNEQRGWHLHAHWLVDARWVDAVELSRTWGRLVGQDYAIVKVMDARSKPNYQKELAKYLVKGHQLATWPAEEIHQFVRAIRGRRFFFVFGSLFQQQRKIKAQLNQNKVPTVCECGCGKFRFETDAQAISRELRQRSRRS